MSLSDVSKYFTEATLDAIIQKSGGVKHTSFEFGTGFKKGDSFLSKVFRICIKGVKANGDKIEVHTIVKSIPDNVARRKVFRSEEFFRNEINFYSKVLPTIEDFQARRKAKHPFIEYPKCLAYYSDGSNDFIALEDMSIDGYKGPDRTNAISLNEVLCAMRVLGRFHGVSLALNALEPDTFKLLGSQLEETYYSDKQKDWYIDFLAIACKNAFDAVSKTYPNSNYEKIAKKFLQPENLFKDQCEIVSAKSKLSVISHGDCWSPNFLTRTDAKGEPIDTKMIDFQLARSSSLVPDVMFYMYSCTDQQLREKHYEDILKVYHKAACDLIADLGANANEVFSWQALQDELLQFGRFGCGMGIESLPASLADDDEIDDLDNITENATLIDVWTFKPFKDPAKRERVATIFKHAIDQKYLV